MISKAQRETNLVFKDISIYVEIFNNSIDQCDLLDDVLQKGGANVKFTRKFTLDYKKTDERN